MLAAQGTLTAVHYSLSCRLPVYTRFRHLMVVDWDPTGATGLNSLCCRDRVDCRLRGREQAPALLAGRRAAQLVLPAGDGLLEVLRAELPLERCLVRLRCAQLLLQARPELRCIKRMPASDKRSPICAGADEVPTCSRVAPACENTTT